VRLEGLGQLKKSTSSGFEPATFRFVLNKMCITIYCSTKIQSLKLEPHLKIVHGRRSGIIYCRQGSGVVCSGMMVILSKGKVVPVLN
jgi:hypothetical protein